MASIRKRTWTARGIEQSAWLVDYFDQAGKRHAKTFPTKKEAEAWRVSALHEVSQGTHTPASTSITLAEVFGRWIEHCEAEGLEHGTIVQRRQHLELHVRPFVGGEKLSSLTMPRIHQLDAQLRKAGRSLAMRRKVLTNIKTALTFAQGQGLVAQNVARGIKLKGENRRGAGSLKEGVDFPTKVEIKALIDNAPARWRPFIITAIFTGMRASELRGLRWQDVNLDHGIIHVRQRADAWHRIGAPKSAAGTRDIPLVPMRCASGASPARPANSISCSPTAPAMSRARAIFSIASGVPCSRPVASPTTPARSCTRFTVSAMPRHPCSSPIWVGPRSASRPCSAMPRSA